MEIKKSVERDSQAKKIIRNGWKNISQRASGRFIVLIFLILCISIFSMYFGATLSGRDYRWIAGNAIKSNISIVSNWFKGLTANPEKIMIDIKYVDFQKLEYKRQIALSNQILITGSDDYVPATISCNGKQVEADIRLKGDWVDHLTGDKWSFRIEIKNGNTLFGMKTMSIQHPRTRNYINEWLFQKALQREDVLALRYKFIDVTLNGKNLGIFALEEHFDKQLVENQQRREGPIIRFNEDLMWSESQYMRNFPNSQTPGFGSYTASDIDVFNTKKVTSEPVSNQQFLKALNLLESLREGKLKTSDVFDVERLAKFFAITDLMGAEHGSRWHNTRFYYNPISSLLEPIGFDGDSGAIKSLVGAKYGVYVGLDSSSILDNYYKMIFSDTEFFTEYVKNLERISNPSYLEEMFNEIGDEMQHNLNIIYKEFPFYYFSKDFLDYNQNYIKMMLNPIKGLQAYFNSFTENFLVIELANIQKLPIEVLSVNYQDSISFKPEDEIILPGKTDTEPQSYAKSKFTLPQDFTWTNEMIQDLTITYKILGASQLRSENIYAWSHLDEDFADNDFIRQQPNVSDFEFLVVDETKKKIYVSPGIWNIDRSLIIPEGYRVFAGEGVRLNLSQNAKILSYSPFEFIGSEENPIVFSSPDFTGQGLVVMSNYKKSRFEYVSFKKLSNPSQTGWTLTGAITFYESPVEFYQCEFANNGSGDDYLNIIRSEFTISNCIFRQTSFDALDIDFSKGVIKNTSFVDIGNDAIDTSGSVLELHDIFIKNAGDKGISAGESSQIIANGVEVQGSEIAISSKDMSEITIDRITISDSSIAFAIFQKKPEFGAASGAVAKLIMNRVEIPYMVEEGSSLAVDGKTIKASYERVEDILYGREYGKSSN